MLVKEKGKRRNKARRRTIYNLNVWVAFLIKLYIYMLE